MNTSPISEAVGLAVSTDPTVTAEQHRRGVRLTVSRLRVDAIIAIFEDEGYVVLQPSIDSSQIERPGSAQFQGP